MSLRRLCFVKKATSKTTTIYIDSKKATLQKRTAIFDTAISKINTIRKRLTETFNENGLNTHRNYIF